MNWELITFIFYSLTASSITILLGQVLYRNGAVFLERIFIQKAHLVGAINKLLLLGFYLLNLGFVFAFFSQKPQIFDGLTCFEFLATKLGTVYLILGAMHLFNLLTFVLIEQYLNRKILFK